MKTPSIAPTFLSLAVAVALQGCSTPPPPPRPLDGEIATAIQRGQRAFSRQQYDMALHAFHCSLRRARMLDDPNGIGNSAHNLASVLVALGQYDDAHPYLDDALAAFSRANTESGLLEVRVLMARVAIAKQEPETARKHLAEANKALTADTRRSDAAVIIHLLSANLACDANDAAAASAALDAAVRAGAHTCVTPAVRAQTANVEGRLAALTGANLQAAQHFDTAAAAYGSAGLPRDVAQTLTAAAVQYAAAGQHGDAADRHYRAARSYHAQALLRPAVDQVMTAVAAAEKSGDTVLIKRTRLLLASIREALRQVSEKETKE